MNFSVCSMRYSSLHQQFTNGEHRDQNSSSSSKKKRLTIVHTQEFLTQVFLMQVYFSWEPADSYQLEVIIIKKSNVFCL